jgi:site-specific DNA-cytosine methylase
VKHDHGSRSTGLTAIDLFSGCGGLTLGLEWAGFRIVGAVEIDPLSVETYKANKKNRERDQKNFRKLRHMGWQIIRIWQHEIEQDSEACIRKILAAVRTVRETRNGERRRQHKLV